MKRLGAVLLVLGALVGCIAGIWVMIGLDAVHLPWIVSIGLVKLILAASLGIMAGGAVLVRLAKKSEGRSRIGA